MDFGPRAFPFFCVSSEHEIPHVRSIGLGGLGSWLRHVGHGRVDRKRRRRNHMASLDRAIAMGCNLFDTAWAYGDGHSERLLGETLRRHRDRRLYVATKIPPKNRRWPARPEYPLDDVFPPDYIREYCERSLKNIGVQKIDLLQFHVWSDHWASDPRWQKAAADLKREKLVEGIGISINRWQPENVLRALDTGVVDAVQVVYNLFDQSPEDRLFPYCQRARHRGHRARAVRRGQPHRHADAAVALAGGRLPEPVLQAREPARHAERVDRLRPVVPATHDAARDDASPHPRSPCRQHGDPRHAQAPSRRGEPRGQRRQPASGPLMAELKGHRWNRTVDFESGFKRFKRFKRFRGSDRVQIRFRRGV